MLRQGNHGVMRKSWGQVFYLWFVRNYNPYMARPLRLEFAGALYHVASRGDRREDIYDSDVDCELYLSILGDVCERFNWECHAYCLMSNHYQKGELFTELRNQNLEMNSNRITSTRRWTACCAARHWCEALAHSGNQEMPDHKVFSMAFSKIYSLCSKGWEEEQIGRGSHPNHLLAHWL